MARRYARAVFDLAVAEGDVDGWLGDLHLIQSFLGEVDVAMLLEKPEIPLAAKQEIVDRSLGKLGRLRRNFVYVLVTNGRVRAIDEIVSQFQALVNDYRGLAVAEVVTAVPLDDRESQRVAQRLEALVGKKIVLQRRVDPSILGGVVARIGDHLIDGSIAGQLDALRDQLSG